MMTMTLGHFVTLTSYNRPTQAKLPDSLLRLNIPGMMLFVYGQELYSQLPNAKRTENLANNSGTIKALLWNHSRRSAIKGLLLKEGHSIYFVTPRIVTTKSYRQLFLVSAVTPHLFGSLNHHSTLQAILRCTCICEFAASSTGRRSHPPFSAHTQVKIPQYTAILLCALTMA